MNGVDGGDTSGTAVSQAGDVNGGGIDDFIIGAPTADVNSQESGSVFDEGETYVVFGRNSSSASIPIVQERFATIYVNESGEIAGNAEGAGNRYQGVLTANTESNVIAGTAGNDNIWAGPKGNDFISSGSGDDVIGVGSEVTLLGFAEARIQAGDGNDFVYVVSRPSSDNNRDIIVDLGSGDDNFWAIDANNTISGSGNNTIGLGRGSGQVDTEEGDDFVYSTEEISGSFHRLNTL